MVDVGSVREVVNLALVVKAAADTVRHNRATCAKLRNTVETLQAIVEPLENTAVVAPGMGAALTKFEEALRRGHDLVTACQKERNIIYLLFTSGWRAKQLLQVKEDINEQIMVVHFAATCEVLLTVRRHIRILQHPPLQGTGVMDGSNINAIIFDSSKLAVATHEFSEENVIRQGGSVTVYKGTLPDELVVAIKKYPDKSGPQSIKRYTSVFQLLIEHENVIKFLGFCHDDGNEMVVEEYMPYGPLFEIIKGSLPKLDWPTTFGVIRGVAQGVAYLHSKDVIHLDLNPDNIVFDSNMNPKIANFERSKLLDENVAEAVSHELVGTMGYMSPEYITDGITAMPSDVFGFGVLLLHTISGMRSPMIVQHPITWAWEVRDALGMNGLLDSSWGNDDQLEKIKRCMEIGLLCTQELPENRPTMPDVVEFLDGNQMLPTPKKPCFI